MQANFVNGITSPSSLCVTPASSVASPQPSPGPQYVRSMMVSWPPAKETQDVMMSPAGSDISTPSDSNLPQRIVIPQTFLAGTMPLPMPGASTAELPIYTGPSSASMNLPVLNVEHIPRGHPQYVLSPLTPGGFLYEKDFNSGNRQIRQLGLLSTIPSYHEYAFVPPFPVGSAVTSPQFVAPPVELMETYLTNEISTIKNRQEKLAKVRQTKRPKRQPAKTVERSERAQQRSRVMGQFAPEPKHGEKYLQVMMELEASQRESLALQRRLEAMEKELSLLRDRANQATQTEQQMRQQLDAQQRLNHDLRAENDLLWKTVPIQDIFSTINDNPFVDVQAFKQKIDLAEISLHPASSNSESPAPPTNTSCNTSTPLKEFKNQPADFSRMSQRPPTLHRRNLSR